MTDNKDSLEDRAKEILKLWTENKMWKIDFFKKFDEINETINYLRERDYITLMFGSNKYFAYYDVTEKGKEWALDN